MVDDNVNYDDSNGCNVDSDEGTHGNRGDVTSTPPAGVTAVLQPLKPVIKVPLELEAEGGQLSSC